MTRRQDTSITNNNNNPSENVPNAILTLTKNVLGQNVTKTIEPMIKRFSVVETRDDPSLLDTTITETTSLSPLNELSTIAVTAVGQVQQQQFVQQQQPHFHSVDPKKKKTKSKIKRKDQIQPATEKVPVIEQLEPVVSITTTQKRKIFILYFT